MSVAIITDAHLGGPGGSAERLLEQLAALPGEGCERLVLLGDLFHIWVGEAKYETPEIVAVVDTLRSLRGSGLHIDYVEGNRDFFIDGGPYADAFDDIANEIAFEDDGRRFLAVHGDGLNDRDYMYHFWRWLSKSFPSRLGMLYLPAALARKMVGVTERQLARTNFKHKSLIPEDVIRNYAQRRLAEGFDVLLIGHFHTELTLEVENGEVRLLDAWFNSHRVEWPGRTE